MAPPNPNSKKAHFFRVKTGCWTCRLRKMKCDETRPCCRACQKSGLECKGLGYESGIQTTKLITVSSSAPPKAPRSLPQFSASRSVRDLVNLAPLIGNILKKHVATIETRAWAPTQIRIQTSVQAYLVYLPSTVGYNAALDSATKCVAAALQVIYSEKDSRTTFFLNDLPDQRWNHVLPLYSTALKHLRSGLKSPTQSTTPEILCASLLLCYFESLRSLREDGAARHIDGINALLAHRGPSTFKTDFEKTLLKGQVVPAASRAVFSSRKSFLCSPEWISTLRSTILTNQDNIDNGDISTEYMILSLIAVDIQIEILKLILLNEKSVNTNNYYIESRRLELVERLVTLRKQVDDWGSKCEDLHTRFPRPSASKVSGQEEAHLRFEEEEDFLILSRMNLVYFDRSYIALGGENSYLVEKKLQNSITQMLALYTGQDKYASHQLAAFMIANTYNGIMQTKDEWLEFSAVNNGSLMSWDMLNRFSKSVGFEHSKADLET